MATQSKVNSLPWGQWHLKDVGLAISEASTFGPVRKIKGYKGGPHKFQFVSIKGRKHSPLYSTIYLEGKNEFNAAYLLEADPTITYYKAQPFTIVYHDGDSIRHSTPDFLAWRHGSPPLLIEVKPPLELLLSSTRNRLNYLENAFARQGVEYRILTTEDTQKQPRMDNLQLLYSRAHRRSDHQSLITAEIETLLRILRSHDGNSTYKQIAKESPLITMRGLANCLFNGFITSSHRFPFHFQFDVTLTEGAADAQ